MMDDDVDLVIENVHKTHDTDQGPCLVKVNRSSPDITYGSVNHLLKASIKI